MSTSAWAGRHDREAEQVMAVETMPAFTIRRGDSTFTDAAFRDWLNAAYVNPDVGVRAVFPGQLDEKGEYTVSVTVYPKAQ